MESSPSHHTEKDGHHHLIRVTVDYVGKEPFHHEFRKDQTVGEVKVAALHHFGLEAGMAGEYVLKHDGRDQADHIALGKFHDREVCFELAMKKEVTKG